MLSTFRHVVVQPHQKSPSDYKEERNHLLEAVKTAVKEVQDFECSLFGGECLTGTNKEAQKLCISLDHVLYHGLRHVSNGYWIFIKNFLHSDALDKIMCLKNVKSAVAKGRAWLHLTLNENSLESYMNSFINNKECLSQHYIDYAFLRDGQSMELLAMLISGLEFVKFNFYLDARHFDVSCAITHLMSPEYDANYSKSFDCLVTSSDSSGAISSSRTSSVSNYVASDSFERLSSSEEITEIEVVHQSAKIMKHKKKHRKESKVHIDNKRIEKLSDRGDVGDKRQSLISDETVSCDLSEEALDENVASPLPVSKNLNDSLKFMVITDQLNWSFSTGNPTSNYVNQKRETPEGQEDPPQITSPSVDLYKINDFGKINDSPVDCNQNSENQKNYIGTGSNSTQSESDNSNCAISVSNKNEDEQNEFSFYDVYNSNNEPAKKPAPCSKSDDESCIQKVNQDNVKTSTKCEIQAEIDSGLSNKRASFIDVDNNMVLYLSLEIFKDDDETFYKMYGTPFWKADRLFVTLTNKMVYILCCGVGDRLFEIKNIARYSEIDYITVSLNYQSFTIVCFDRRYKYTVNTLDENLTRSILSSLEVAIRRISRCHAPPNVYTDATAQRISLQKSASQKLNCELKDIIIEHYALIHWEDSLGNLSLNSVTMKAGHMFINKIVVTLMSSKLAWTPVYILFKNNVIEAYKNDSDVNPQWRLKIEDIRQLTIDKHILQLSIDQKHKVQLMIPLLDECQQWHHVLKQAIDNQNKSSNDSIDTMCVPSSLMLANETLFVCDESIETGHTIVRQMASLSNLSIIHVDSDCQFYCVLAFDSIGSINFSGDWIIYFYSQEELDKFLKCIGEQWEKLFKVKISMQSINEDFLKHKCRENYSCIHR